MVFVGLSTRVNHLHCAIGVPIATWLDFKIHVGQATKLLWKDSLPAFTKLLGNFEQLCLVHCWAIGRYVQQNSMKKFLVGVKRILTIPTGANRLLTRDCHQSQWVQATAVDHVQRED